MLSYCNHLLHSTFVNLKFIDLKLFFHGYIVLDLIKTFDPISLAQP